MESVSKTSVLFKQLGAAVLAGLLAVVFIRPVHALEPDAQPELQEFVNMVRDGNAELLRGVYVPGVLAFPIIQQPKGNPSFVSSAAGVVTSFSLAAAAGNVGLLAHNYLAGVEFSRLTPGREVVLVYGDGRMERFLITQVRRFRALTPSSPRGMFTDLDTQDTMNAEALFNRIYLGERRVVFQTCLEIDGDLSGGRLFVIAEPAQRPTTTPNPTGHG